MSFVSLFFVILAILGLSFLIFIHELGHYFMARRLGMKVETFSIGFGRPIYSWIRDGVKWQIGWLLFGGFVKIAGMDTSDSKTDPYEVKDGFFGKSPLDRIKVAFMGPFVNIVFALLAFTALWFINGRNKNFSEYTHIIGWIDPKSELFSKGIRPGDEITLYNEQPFEGAKDHVMMPMMSAEGVVGVSGNRYNFHTGERTPYSYTVKAYSNPNMMDKEILTAGILEPASYLLYDKLPNGKENPLLAGSPMENSGIQYGDRIVWVDGVQIYSKQGLSNVLNDERALLTIKRDQETLLRRVPRILVEELKLDAEIREELIDWQYEAGLKGMKIQKMYTIPYNLNNEAVVESRVSFIDKDNEEDAFPKHPYSVLEMPLEEGDKIIAVDGIPVTRSYQILSGLQQRHVSIIVERDPKLNLISSWQNADELFNKQYDWDNIHKLASQIGMTVHTEKSAGNLVLLNPIVPKMRKDFLMSPEMQAQYNDEFQERLREIEKIANPEKRAHERQALEKQEKQLMLGLALAQDKKVLYNPSPLALFDKVFEEIWVTLKALFTGALNPKWMSGPVGIVQVVHDNSMVSLKEALFWLGAISLNLGVLNLLPLPVLDGGTICFSLYELLTGRKLKTKTLEKLIIPFAFILIAFFLFITYHDLYRLISHWTKW